MTREWLRSMAPLPRQVVTSMGSISGVRPTATESEKSRASTQSPLVTPEMTKTTGSMMSMRRMSRRLVDLIPTSNEVSRLRPTSVPVASPNIVRAPVAATVFFSSWTNRSTPETSTMAPMMSGVERSRSVPVAKTQSVRTETMAMKIRM